MSADRTERVRELFLAARGLDRDERTAFLQRVTAGDTALLQEVRDLLEADEVDASFLESPALGHGFREQAVESIVTTHEEQQLDRIGPYRVEELIGEGGFARVYSAQQEAPVRRRVAIKLLKPGVATQQVIRRFEAERQHLASMDHPAIAHIFDAGSTEDGRPFFVMEFIDGQPIAKFCTEHKLDHRARVQLVRRVCEAVQHAHSKGVIHRDLKPSNILVGNNPSDPHIKIIDFGIAKVISESAPDPAMHTRTGQIVGTLPYASPEQLTHPTQPIDTRCDVYALGAVLYELLTGKLPHDVCKDSIPEAARRITHETPASLGSIDTTLRGDLETIVAKALSHAPDERYQSASELAADLGRFLRGDAVLARPPSLSYQLRKLALRHRGASAGVITTFLVVIAAFVWVVSAERRAQREYESARETAHLLLSTAIDDLGAITGTIEARRDLLAGVLPFVEQHRDDPDIARDYARALWAASDLAIEQGQIAESLTDRRAALGVWEQLAADSPDDLDLRASLSIALVKIGDCHKAAGDLTEAKSWYLRALGIDEALTALDPDRRRFKSNLAWSHQRLGWLASRRHGLERTQTHFDTYAALAAELLADDAEDHATLYGSYECEAILADLYWHVGEPEQAAATARSAWEHLGQAFQLAPENRTYRRAIPIALRYLATSSSVAGDWTESARLMDEAIVRLQALIRVEPESEELQFLLGSMHCSRAGIALALANADSCAAHLATVEDLIRQNLAQPDTGIRWRYLLVRALAEEEELALHNGDAVRAADCGVRACEVYRQLAAAPDANATALRGYADCLRDGRIDGVVDMNEALNYLRRADELSNGRDPYTLKMIAEIELARGDSAAALEAINRARELVSARATLREELEELAKRAAS